MKTSLDSFEGNSHQIILLPNGQYKTFTVSLDEGKLFRCECGSNCFHKYYDETERCYCNGCDAKYIGE
jgi:hypothetical protein